MTSHAHSRRNTSKDMYGTVRNASHAPVRKSSGSLMQRAQYLPVDTYTHAHRNHKDSDLCPMFAHV
eukprot:5683132-Amphidinium_carterae.1